MASTATSPAEHQEKTEHWQSVLHTLVFRGHGERQGNLELPAKAPRKGELVCEAGQAAKRGSGSTLKDATLLTALSTVPVTDNHISTLQWLPAPSSDSLVTVGFCLSLTRRHSAHLSSQHKVTGGLLRYLLLRI